MKKLIIFLILLSVLLIGCTPAQQETAIVATTLPIYEFTLRLCADTDIPVSLLITESVSCLHDYTLKVDQMRMLESAQLVILNGAGLEDFLEDALFSSENIVNSSQSLELRESHGHDHGESHDHDHEEDPHIWLSPNNAKVMATNICEALSTQYPHYETTFRTNLVELEADLDSLQSYGEDKLSQLSCRELITFHDGFSYLADSFGLTVLRSVEEESGSEASAAELIELIEEVRHHDLPAIFTEINGAVSAAQIVSAETGVKIYTLDMGMSTNSYFDAMYHNIDTLWEALQ